MTTLRLVLEPSQDAFDVDDDMPLRVRLVNDGDDPVKVNGRLAVSSDDGAGELTFSVVGPSGEPLPFGSRVNLGRPGPDDVATISPTRFVGVTIDLVDYFNLDEPGTYRISATYRSSAGGENGEEEGEGLPADVWTGEVTSDEVSIEVQ
jgi:hypothetical protein